MDQSELEDRIYEAAVLPELWPRLLEDLAPVANATSGILMGFPAANPEDAQLVAPEAFEGLTKNFVSAGWSGENVRWATGVRNGSAFQPRFISEEDIFGEAAFEHEAMYRDFLIPAGLGRSIGAVFRHPHGDIVILTFERPYEAGPIDEATRVRLDGIRPAMARASLLSYRLAFERVRGSVETLEAFGLPAAAVMRGARVVVANALFAEKTELLSIGMRDRLRFHDRRANAAFGEALDAAGGAPVPMSVPVRSDEGFVRHVLHVLPVRRAAYDVLSAADAIVVLSSCEDGLPDRSAVVSALFDLSFRESQLAWRIASGETLGDIARSDGVSIETVRNQLKSVFRKTGCSRQAELTRLISDLLSPLQAGRGSMSG